MRVKLISLVAALGLCGSQASAVVIRHDVSDEEYRVEAAALPALVDLPGQGHGVLVARRWVVTVTHTVPEKLENVEIAGESYPVLRTVSHPGHFDMPEGLASGDAAPVIAFLKANHDITLIELGRDVTGIEPVPLYRGTQDAGKVAMLFGKGSTGNGLTGQDDATSARGALRRAQNQFVTEEGRWLSYRFDCGPGALPLEGVAGSSDSGAPMIVDDDGIHKLAGLVDWKSWQGEASSLQDAVCGQMFYAVRISHYAGWIDSVIAGEE